MARHPSAQANGLGAGRSDSSRRPEAAIPTGGKHPYSSVICSPPWAGLGMSLWPLLSTKRISDGDEPGGYNIPVIHCFRGSLERDSNLLVIHFVRQSEWPGTVCRGITAMAGGGGGPFPRFRIKNQHEHRHDQSPGRPGIEQKPTGSRAS